MKDDSQRQQQKFWGGYLGVVIFFYTVLDMIMRSCFDMGDLENGMFDSLQTWKMYIGLIFNCFPI